MNWRVVAAVLGGAAMASLIANTGLYLVMAVFVKTDTLSLFPAYLGFLFYGFLVGAIVAASLGLAWHTLAMKRGWHRPFYYWGPALACGVLSGVALWVAIASGFGVEDPDAWSALLFLVLYASALSGLTGYFAWLIRRPDRDIANPANTTS
jgi:hypothetical protein